MTTLSTHADKANLTSAQDWASIDSDGGYAFAPSPGDITITKMGQPVHTSCCPSGTVEFLVDQSGDNDNDAPAAEGCCDAVTATLQAMTIRMSTHAPKFLLLTGSLRSDSCSRRVAVEAGRILASYGAEVKLFDATDLPLFSQDIDPKSNDKVVELRILTRWCEGMIWVSPEVHGNFSAVFKNQIDWMPLTEGALRPTQGKTVAVMQVEAGSQSFNTVNNLRVLGRWMRMVVTPNQSSIPKAYMEFNDDGTLKEGPLRSRVVDVVDELFRYTLLLRDQQPLLLQRYSEHTAAAAKKNLKDTSKTADASILKGLVDPIIIDVRSEKEVAEGKGGEAIPGSVHVPLNVDGNPQSVHVTTAQEFYNKLVEAGIDMPSLSKKDIAFIAHCTKGNTDYSGRCNRATALLRDLGYQNAHNGGSADEIRLALDLIKKDH
uniref:Rhodanese domain-containing protein n=1 Tax=Minutocellus polymorphus TaxID=265543 RepID=A0A6U0IS42_9STRA|eukprot:CAMPEP_0197726134 /NCGR_PEP_ID=MMETSP1434-20131217/13566_1 /TAXON_ID=265543 /ORGANISM="Minutocellus polymorphus, Strain CCMP3303" /LENGTH=431 /DNA_ID=CAMNT_0043311961 /DNA_START=128 /DNA_END=1423 /DNA_ORIENTATION=-